jgi:hypothetical protein
MQNGQEKSRTRLATIVHVSDLHFGALDKASGDSDLSAGVPSWWRYCSYFNGYLGHHANALIHFEDIFVKLQQQENAILVVTGDLTATGADLQFKHAKNYLESTLIVGKHGPTGLKVPDVLASRTVPGNHDHWPGNHKIFGPPAALYSHFPGPPPSPAPLPIQVNLIRLRNSSTLLLAGIDTSAEVTNVNKAFGRGHFVQQLQMLQKVIPGPQSNEIRVLLMHHSPLMKGIPLSISSASRRVLDATIKQFNISVLLTGHAHFSLGEISSHNYRGRSWPVLEARCGTTLQRDELPPPFIAPRFKRASGKNLRVNTFLVHRLYEDHGRITWETKEYWRLNLGFVERGLIKDKRGNPIQPVTVV